MNSVLVNIYLNTNRTNRANSQFKYFLLDALSIGIIQSVAICDMHCLHLIFSVHCEHSNIVFNWTITLHIEYLITIGIVVYSFCSD